MVRGVAIGIKGREDVRGTVVRVGKASRWNDEMQEVDEGRWCDHTPPHGPRIRRAS